MPALLTPALIPPSLKFGLTLLRSAIPPPIVKEKKYPNDILSLLFSLFSLFFLYHTYQSITITLFSVIVKSTVIVKSSSACSFSSFLFIFFCTRRVFFGRVFRKVLFGSCLYIKTFLYFFNLFPH